MIVYFYPPAEDRRNRTADLRRIPRSEAVSLSCKDSTVKKGVTNFMCDV